MARGRKIAERQTTSTAVVMVTDYNVWNDLRTYVIREGMTLSLAVESALRQWLEQNNRSRGERIESQRNLTHHPASPEGETA